MFLKEELKSFPESGLGGADSRFPGQVRDLPPPAIVDFNLFAAVLVPQSWVDKNIEENIKPVSDKVPYYAFGGAAASTSDQANSVSKAHRNAAVMAFTLASGDPASQENFWSNLFPKMFDISDKTNFPPVFGANHAGLFVTGPLKEDWTKACPFEWTFEERNEKCISAQEAIYGTETLSRLEAIKKAVDPQFMLNCNNCVGSNLDLPKASHSKDEGDELESSNAGTQSDEPSGASYAYAPTYVAVVVAAAFHLFLSIVN